MRYLKTFVISAPIFGVFYHFMTREPLPWWPDTVIMGGAMGALASLVLMRLSFTRRATRRLLDAVFSLFRL
jgi:hypothetical protein